MKLDYLDIRSFKMIVDASDLDGLSVPSRLISLLMVATDCSVPYILLKPPIINDVDVQKVYKGILERNDCLAEIEGSDFIPDREFGFQIIARSPDIFIVRDEDISNKYTIYMSAVENNIDVAAKSAYIISNILGFSSLLSFEVRFSVYELLSNSVEHGVGNDSNQWIQIDISRTGLKLFVSIIDKGVEFDPTKSRTFDISEYIESGEKRGLGLVLTRKLADTFKYERVGGYNRIFFEKSMGKVDFGSSRKKEERMAQFEVLEPEVLNDGTYLYRLSGDLDTKGALVLEDLMDSILEQGITRVILDFNEVPFVSSAGVGIVLALVSSLRDRGGEVVFRNVSPKVRAVFRLLNLEDYLVIEDSDGVRLS